MSDTPIRQAVILAGGLGTRLGDETAATPKPVVACGDRPFLAWLLRELCRFGIDDVLLLTGHLSAVLAAALPAIEATLPRQLRIRCAVEPRPLGTGGALSHARALLAPRFLLCNGDSLFDANLAPLLAPGGDGCRILLRGVADTDRYGVVTVSDGVVAGFLPRAERPEAGLVNAGLYVLDRDLFDRHAPAHGGAWSLEAGLLPALAAAGALTAVVATGWFIDIGIPADLARARAALGRVLHRPALFLDRDGTINRDHGWVGTRDRWEWVDGALDAIAHATQAGWHVFVVTNQSGIARGLYDEAALDALHGWMADAVRAHGGTIDDIRFCPFHEAAVVPRYRGASDWRKPAPGMLLDLIAAWELDPARAVLIGDQPSDVAAAAAAGVRGIRFDSGNLLDAVRSALDPPPLPPAPLHEP